MFSYLSQENYYNYNVATALGGCVALLLVGATFIAIGMLISALTENQMIAAIGTITVSAGLLGASLLNSYINIAPIRAFISWLSIYARFSNFTKGYFDFASLIYYASFAFVCLFITVRVYEKRRWA
jgi:ABC-2 type transport system permease protein